MQLLQSKNVIEACCLTCILMRFSLERLSVVEKPNERILLSEGIAVVLEEVGLLDLYLNVTVLVYFVGSHFKICSLQSLSFFYLLFYFQRKPLNLEIIKLTKYTMLPFQKLIILRKMIILWNYNNKDL